MSIKNIIKLFLVLIIPFLGFCAYLEYNNRTAWGISSYDIAEECRGADKCNPPDNMLRGRYSYGRKPEFPEPQAVKIRTKKDVLVIPPNQLQKSELYINEFEKKPVSKSGRYAKDLLFINTADIETIKTGSLHNPMITAEFIKLNDGRVLVYDKNIKPPGCKAQSQNVLVCGKDKTAKVEPEIYNPETKSYKLLKPVPYELGDFYYKYKNGNLLFITPENTIKFDIKTESFKKVSNGIPLLKDKKYTKILIPYSDEKIYIIMLSQKGIITHSIEYNLADYKISTADTAIETKFLHNPGGYAVINNSQVLFDDNNGNLYIYDSVNKSIQLKAELKLKAYRMFKLGNKIYARLSMPAVQIINLEDFSISAPIRFNHFMDECITLTDKIFCRSGIIFDEKSGRVYKTAEKAADSYASFAALNDKEILTAGCSIRYGCKDSKIIKINKLNSDEFIRSDDIEYDKLKFLMQTLINEGILE